jgi:hypothetical protein
MEGYLFFAHIAALRIAFPHTARNKNGGLPVFREEEIKWGGKGKQLGGQRAGATNSERAGASPLFARDVGQPQKVKENESVQKSALWRRWD